MGHNPVLHLVDAVAQVRAVFQEDGRLPLLPVPPVVDDHLPRDAGHDPRAVLLLHQ